MFQGLFQQTEPNRDGREIEIDDVLRARQVEQRSINYRRAVGVTAIGVRSCEQRQPKGHVLGPIVGKYEQIGECLGRLSIQNKGLRAVASRDGEIGAGLDEIRTRIDRSAIRSSVKKEPR